MTMKKKFFLLIGILSIGTNYAQVGINTENPFGVFHIDTKANTGGTKATPTGDADDFIIDDSGNMGIGTAKPTAMLDVNGLVRIRGGNPKAGYAYTSDDANGNGKWAEIKPSKDTRLTHILKGVSTSHTFPIGFESELDKFTVSTPGNYIAIFRWWGVIDNLSSLMNVYLMLYINGTQVDKIEHYMTTNDPRGVTCFSTSLYAMDVPANATVRITAQFGNSSHTIGKWAAQFTKPSIVFFGI